MKKLLTTLMLALAIVFTSMVPNTEAAVGLNAIGKSVWYMDETSAAILEDTREGRVWEVNIYRVYADNEPDMQRTVIMAQKYSVPNIFVFYKSGDNDSWHPIYKNQSLGAYNLTVYEAACKCLQRLWGESGM